MKEPSYLALHQSGKLSQIAETLYGLYDSCTLCPRLCKVNRTKGKKGFCRAGSTVKVSSASPHFGEERPLVGVHGSGTIFLTHCNHLCIYCQNWDISHKGEGDEISDKQLAALMLRLQGMGCHNINFVTPTHFLPNIITALAQAAENGLKVPLVYNTGGYESVEILKLLEGVFDIYMPDYKYSNGEIAGKYTPGANDYPEIAQAALKEMHRQTGVLQTDKYNIATRGLIIRHLILPDDLAGSEAFFKFVAQELDKGTYVNIMAQYHPCYQAHNHPSLSRRITGEEFQQAEAMARKYGLYNLD